MLKKIFFKINFKSIILPQIYFLRPKIIRNPYLFIPICIIITPYSVVAFVVYFAIILTILCVLMLLEKLKNITKKLMNYFWDF
jgi:hypothetical protein|tara:strand:+ start:2751 stop:2999 length:249 start_codon:yes stop_codon:yes gene_type:complete